LLLAAACTDITRAGNDWGCGEDLECLRQRHATHPVKDVGYMRAFQALPLNRRVMAAPSKLLDYLNLDNKLQGFPNHPRAARFGRRLSTDMKEAIGEIPDAVKALIDDRLMGIFLVQDLGGTGATDYVYDQNHDPVGAFVVFDAEVLTRPANNWSTWKESTPFIPDPDFDLQAIIESPPDDNRKQALQYILLHELGHVASVGADIHPRWDDWDCQVEPPGRYAFFQLSWQLKDGSGCEIVSKFDQRIFTLRKDLVYYFGAKLPAAAGPEVYGQLRKTNFPTLYAANSPYDDFAESFVSYVHVVLMDKPFEIRIDRQGQRVSTYEACWGTSRCAEKQRILSSLFSNQAP